jgi:hypothetical protein
MHMQEISESKIELDCSTGTETITITSGHFFFFFYIHMHMHNIEIVMKKVRRRRRRRRVRERLRSSYIYCLIGFIKFGFSGMLTTPLALLASLTSLLTYYFTYFLCLWDMCVCVHRIIYMLSLVAYTPHNSFLQSFLPSFKTCIKLKLTPHTLSLTHTYTTESSLSRSFQALRDFPIRDNKFLLLFN